MCCRYQLYEELNPFSPTAHPAFFRPETRHLADFDSQVSFVESMLFRYRRYEESIRLSRRSNRALDLRNEQRTRVARQCFSAEPIVFRRLGCGALRLLRQQSNRVPDRQNRHPIDVYLTNPVGFPQRLPPFSVRSTVPFPPTAQPCVVLTKCRSKSPRRCSALTACLVLQTPRGTTTACIMHLSDTDRPAIVRCHKINLCQRVC